jgi:hypothetical protein
MTPWQCPDEEILESSHKPIIHMYVMLSSPGTHLRLQAPGFRDGLPAFGMAAEASDFRLQEWVNLTVNTHSDGVGDDAPGFRLQGWPRAWG